MTDLRTALQKESKGLHCMQCSAKIHVPHNHPNSLWFKVHAVVIFCFIAISKRFLGTRFNFGAEIGILGQEIHEFTKSQETG